MDTSFIVSTRRVVSNDSFVFKNIVKTLKIQIKKDYLKYLSEVEDQLRSELQVPLKLVR